MNSRAGCRYPAARLLVFARAPVAGAVKTRLAAGIGAAAAARLYRQLLRGTLEMAHAAGLAPLELHVAPDTGHPFIRSLARRLSLDLRRQRGADLGQRMHHALQEALADSQFAVLIGSDCAVMDADYLDQACRALQAGSELVIGPAEDGGYLLIGVRRCCPELFESIPWGSAGVLGATRERARTLGLRYAELDALWDIDTPADLQRWRALHTSGTLPAPGSMITL